METNKHLPIHLDTKKSWLVVFSSSLLFFYSFMQLNILNPISVAVMRDFQISATQMGWISSMYFFANFFFLFPAGLLLDRFSTKKLILIAMVFAIISMFGFAISHTIILASFFRFLSGIGGAFCFISSVRLASRWFSPKKLAFVIGCLVTVGMLGGAVAQTPVSILSDLIGWRSMMLSGGGLGIIFFTWIWIFVKNCPKKWEEKEDEKGIEKIGFWHSIGLVLKNHYNWLGGFYTAFLNLPIFILGALWGELYLTQGHNMTKTRASYIISAMFIGSIIGAPLMGKFSDFIKKRKLPMILGAGLSFFVILAIIYMPYQNFASLFILFLLIGFFTSTQALSYPTITELNSPLITGSANSIISSILIASGFVFQPLFGWLMQQAQNADVKVATYTITSFYKAMAILPITFVCGVIFAFLLKETKCRLHKK